MMSSRAFDLSTRTRVQALTSEVVQPRTMTSTSTPVMEPHQLRHRSLLAHHPIMVMQHTGRPPLSIHTKRLSRSTSLLLPLLWALVCLVAWPSGLVLPLRSLHLLIIAISNNCEHHYIVTGISCSTNLHDCIICMTSLTGFGGYRL